jgi:hypothetical protein
VQNLPDCNLRKGSETLLNTMELVMTRKMSASLWTDSTTKLMKMFVIAILEKKGFKIVTDSIDQGRETVMMYKE